MSVSHIVAQKGYILAEWVDYGRVAYLRGGVDYGSVAYMFFVL